MRRGWAPQASEGPDALPTPVRRALRPAPVLAGQGHEKAESEPNNLPETDQPGLSSQPRDEKTEAQARAKGTRGHQDQLPQLTDEKTEPWGCCPT